MMIPREFLGRARAFCAKIDAADREFVVLRDDIFMKLHSRLRRRPSIRQETVIDIHRRFLEAGSQYGQRSECEVDYTKRQVVFVVPRLCASVSWEDGWDRKELGVEIALMSLSASAADGVRVRVRALCAFGLHAIGRYHQRAFRVGDDDLNLIQAIWDIWPQLRRVMDSGKAEFSLDTDTGGEWHGCMANAQSEAGGETYAALTVRTYYTIEDSKEAA